MITFNDQMLLEQKGISEEKIALQLSHFKNGFPFMNIVKPATPGNGILVLAPNQMSEAIAYYDKALASGIKTIKFVPASGAATRMFKALYDAMDQLIDGNHSAINKDAQAFFANLKHFAFAKKLTEKIGIDTSIPIDIEKDGAKILQTLLLPQGLNYGSLPKGVLLFHMLDAVSITPVEEHLLEGALYAKDADSHVHIHFTVSPEHDSLFKKIVAEKKEGFEKRFSIDYKITFSQQKTSTDTIAVTPKNELFRQENGALVFRPAGHGALIENLNDLHADIVFIKNIDNVVPEHLVNDTVNYKKALAGTLIKIRQKVFDALHALTTNNGDVGLTQLIKQLEQEYHLPIPQSIQSLSGIEQKDALIRFLNRPIRVCGMVRNEGEPGGGPFWVNDGQGNLSLQIVESSQIDLGDASAKAVMAGSTHFNPVDLVCGIKNYKGQKFDLTLYVDADTGFISEKSLNGKPLRALELPGLWNGAMAHWLTIFVEVPLTTFNPVKTVNDLLRPQHQPQNH
jgi:hypothetical protein